MSRRQSKDPFEFYSSPPWVIELLLPLLPPIKSVLDPCCGDGAILDAIKSINPQIDTFGIEIEENRFKIASTKHSAQFGDALQQPWHPVDFIITNPPFSKGLEFLKYSLEKLPNVPIAALLPLTFMGSIGRSEFHQQHPSEVLVLKKRPSFNGRKTTDQIPYAFFIYGTGRAGMWSVV